jgi:hypothetical protein
MNREEFEAMYIAKHLKDFGFKEAKEYIAGQIKDFVDTDDHIAVSYELYQVQKLCDYQQERIENMQAQIDFMTNK